MPPKLNPVDKKGRGTPASRQSLAGRQVSPPPTPAPQLKPLRDWSPSSSSKGKPAMSPAAKKAALKQQHHIAAQRKLQTPEAMSKALRQDLFQLQNLIDGKNNQGACILSYNARKLESEILVLQQQNASTPEQEVFDLLNLLATKCGEAGEALGGMPTSPLGGPVVNTRSSTTSPTGHLLPSSATGTGMPPAPGGPASAAQPTSVLSNLFDLLKMSQQQQQHHQAERRDPSVDSSDEVSAGDVTIDAFGSVHRNSSSLTPTSVRAINPCDTASATSQLLDRASSKGDLLTIHGGTEPAAAASVRSNYGASMKSTAGTNVPVHANSVLGASAISGDVLGSASASAIMQQPAPETQPQSQQGRMAPMSAGSLASLQSIGVEVPTVGDMENGAIDTDVIVKQLVTAARRVKNLQDRLDHRLKASGEAGERRQVQSRLELEANQSVLHTANQQIDDLKKTIATSRFAPNHVKSLATVRDAPMSFQVEQQYQRDITRTQLRVQELESKYDKLWKDGVHDRETVKRLTAEGIELRAQIANLEKDKEVLSASRDEQTALFQGASQARSEEARMSLVAVKQLESRVGELTGQLKHEKSCKETLIDNFKHLFADFNRSERLLQQGRNRLESTLDTFADYKVFYNQDTVESVARLQGQLLTVSHTSDQQEALLTLQKQQLEDNAVLRTLTEQELSGFMDKLKASTEWKMINVRAADEARQLGMRLLALITDREKKEAGMASQHAERLEMYKTRADEEIEARREKRSQDITPVDAPGIEADYKNRYQKRQQTLDKVQSSSKPLERIKLALKLKDEYTAECQTRMVKFDNFFEAKYPSEE